MIKQINKTDEFFKKLEREGKVKYLDSPEDLKTMEEMNKSMEETRRDFLYKNAMSERSARECYFTA
ncbi:hypothetical protein HYT91_01815 [Candidatus Pacearchaeota archaeon]|nr:hypothetical protein [Candidatus Pacearchaeota archaeon]